MAQTARDVSVSGWGSFGLWISIHSPKNFVENSHVSLPMVRAQPQARFSYLFTKNWAIEGEVQSFRYVGTPNAGRPGGIPRLGQDRSVARANGA